MAVPRTYRHRPLLVLLAGLALLLGACRDSGGLTPEQDAAIRATIDPAAWALMLVLPDAATVEAQTGVRPAAFHTLEYDPVGRLVAAAVADDSTAIATFDLRLAEGPADRGTGAAVLGRFAVATTVEVGDMPEAVAGALNLAALVNAQRVIDINYTPPATPDSLEVGLGLLDAFEAAGREWLAVLEGGAAGHAPRALGTCEETRRFERGLWMFIARPCIEYGRASALLAAGDLSGGAEAVRAGVDGTAAVIGPMRAALE